MFKPRVQPPKCLVCNHEPWLCPSCGDYQCACPAPWTVKNDAEKKRARKQFRLRQHYDRDGLAYVARFVDDEYPTEEEDERWLESLIGENSMVGF